ncbi:MAG: DUF1385 domain-containing protein, partial [Anaerovoracaceae bacterium]
KWKKIPVLRGIMVFLSSLVQGTGILLYSAEILEEFTDAEGKPLYEKDKTTIWLEKHLGEKGALNLMLYASVALAILLTVGVFIILPTWLIHGAKVWGGIHNEVALNFLEGAVRIAMFVLYVKLISGMDDIKKVFQYHGAEHKTIHCYESGLELTPENAQTFYTLHPRCGTSFLMFVMVLSLLIFSLLGWPGLAARILSRLLLIPLIAGLSYELLQFTGRHDGRIVKALSMPGIALQKLTTKEPTLEQLEVAIVAMKAVMPAQEREEDSLMNGLQAGRYWVGTLLRDGLLQKDEEATEAYRKRKTSRGKAQ